MWRTLILAMAALLAACGPKQDPAQTARLSALEAENRGLKDRLQRTERENAELKNAPAAEVAPPRPARKPEKREPVAPLPDLSAEVARLRSALAESQGAVTELEARITKLDAELAAAVAQNKRLVDAESELSERLTSSTRELEKARGLMQRNSDGAAQLEEARKLRDNAAAQAKKNAQFAQAVGELQDVYRRRETYVNSILQRYKEITEQYRAISLDARRSGEATPSRSNDLSRIQQAVTMAEEDLRQLNSWNARALLAEKKLVR
ncbi:MAG: hypothetical protein ABIZ80_17465 [Bryobacteraceae bacterium]